MVHNHHYQYAAQDMDNHIPLLSAEMNHLMEDEEVSRPPMLPSAAEKKVKRPLVAEKVNDVFVPEKVNSVSVPEGVTVALVPDEEKVKPTAELEVEVKPTSAVEEELNYILVCLLNWHKQEAWTRE